MNRKDWKKEDFTWLEDTMKQESEEIEVPDSLSPEKMKEKLENVSQNSWRKKEKRIVTAAASAALITVAAWQAGRLSNFGLNSSSMGQVKREPAQIETAESSIKDFTEENKGLSDRAEEEKSAETGMASEDMGKNSLESEETVKEQDTSAALDKVEQSDSFQIVKDFQEGEGKLAVTSGAYIYFGKGKDLVISKFQSGEMTELTRVSGNQPIKELYLIGKKLICITSEGGSTGIETFYLEKSDILQKKDTVFVDGAWQCSYLEEDMLYVFTEKGNIEQYDILNQQLNVFSTEEQGAKYYQTGEIVYAFSQNEAGCSIQKYIMSSGKLRKDKSAVCEAARESIVAVEGDGMNLKLLLAEESKVTLQVYDKEMRLIQVKSNDLGAEVFTGKFTKEGVLVLSYLGEEMKCNLLAEETLETKAEKVVMGCMQIISKNLVLQEEPMRIGFSGWNSDTGEEKYYLYSYEESRGFEQINSDVLSQVLQEDFMLENSNSVWNVTENGLQMLLKG